MIARSGNEQEYAQSLDARVAVQEQRVRALEKRAEAMDRIAVSVERLATLMEQVQKDTIKNACKIDALEKEPGETLKYYKKLIVGCLLSALIGAAVAAFVTLF